MNVLEEANHVINGPRLDTYGDATQEFIAFAKVWSAYKGVEFTPLDYANMLILMKVMRTRHEYHRDSYVDICGYAALAEKYQDSVDPAKPEFPYLVLNEKTNGALVFETNDTPAQPVGTFLSGLITPPDVAERLTEVLRDWEWITEDGDVVYRFEDGVWWMRSTGDDHEDPWVRSSYGSGDVGEIQGPFKLYTE
jgi:hypothetical protein